MATKFDVSESIRKMPPCLSGYDPHQHKTAADFAELAQFELDLRAEGEDSDIRTARQEQQVRKYLEWLDTQQ